MQHLKAYASTEALKQECVDPRFKYVTRGCAPTVEELGGKWAVGSEYGGKLVAIMESLLATDSTDYSYEPEPEPQPEPEPIPVPEPEPQPEPEPEPQPSSDIDEKIGLIQKLLDLIQRLIDFFKSL